MAEASDLKLAAAYHRYYRLRRGERRQRLESDSYRWAWEDVHQRLGYGENSEKVPLIAAYAQQRPTAWIDDLHTSHAHHWAADSAAAIC